MNMDSNRQPGKLLENNSEAFPWLMPDNNLAAEPIEVSRLSSRAAPCIAIVELETSDKNMDNCARSILSFLESTFWQQRSFFWNFVDTISWFETMFSITNIYSFWNSRLNNTLGSVFVVSDQSICVVSIKFPKICATLCYQLNFASLKNSYPPGM